MNQRAAFNLIELVLVTVIIGIAAAIAAPRVTGALVRQRADAAARRLIADITRAQRAARAASASRSVVFDAVAETYRLPDTPDPNGASAEYVVDLMEEPYNALLVSADFDGVATLEFSGFGTPVSAGSIVLRVGNDCREVRVDASGRASAATTSCTGTVLVVNEGEALGGEIGGEIGPPP